MIGGSVARFTIQRIRPTGLVDDGHGNQQPDFTDAEPVDLMGWAIDATSTAEDVANRDGEQEVYTLRGPFGADVESSDHLRLPFDPGQDYQIQGDVLRQPGPSSLTSHIIVRLSRWEG